MTDRLVELNVLGEPMVACSVDPLTGFYRDGCCSSGAEDVGTHVVCAEVTADFLVFSKAAGNDLSTPRPEYRFPGLRHGDRWCLCAPRWVEAWKAGVAPRLYLASTNQRMLEYVELSDLLPYAIDHPG
jgi:uncharacterized protein (DUF2237 family)